MTLRGRHLLSIGDLSPSELRWVLDTARAIKADPGAWADRWSGKRAALLFEKPSTRTRVSLESAVTALGGHAIVLRSDELQTSRGESVADTARVLSRYVHAITLRTYDHGDLIRAASAASIPVINALSDIEHPCQALADLFTIEERFDAVAGRTIAYLGDGNNVAHSLMLGAAAMGAEMRIACPAGHGPDERIVSDAVVSAKESGGSVRLYDDPRDAADGADVLYTDVWVSIGDDPDAPLDVFEGYAIDAGMVERAAGDAIVMHCLPAHRGQEIAAEVIDGPRSAVWDQAENRLYVQMAILTALVA